MAKLKLQTHYGFHELFQFEYVGQYKYDGTLWRKTVIYVFGCGQRRTQFIWCRWPSLKTSVVDFVKEQNNVKSGMTISFSCSFHLYTKFNLRVKFFLNLTMWKNERPTTSNKLCATLPASENIDYCLSSKCTIVFVLSNIFKLK
jgi:hypothetical protein